MKPAQDVLNRIKWDEEWKAEEFTIEYLDLNELSAIPYTDIERIEDEFMIIKKDGKETNIPLHRIRIIKRNGDIVWQRSSAD